MSRMLHIKPTLTNRHSTPVNLPQAYKKVSLVDKDSDLEMGDLSDLETSANPFVHGSSVGKGGAGIKLVILFTLHAL